MKLICALLTVWYSLRSWNPFTPLGSVPVSGHLFVEEPPYGEPGRFVTPLRCDRCGSVSIGWVEA